MSFPLKKLDWYIMRRFILTFFVAILLIIGIVIIFDVSEKIDNFVEHEAPLSAIILDYYVNFVPYFINMFSPLFVFITVIFFTSKMAQNSEIVAILSCGISFHRMMVPYIISAAIIAAMSLSLNLFIIPQANETRLEFEAKYVKQPSALAGQNVHYQISPGEFVFVEGFSSWNNTAYKFTLERIEHGRLVSKLSAETAVWDTTFGGWRLNKYFIRDYMDDMEDDIRSGNQIDTVINLTVDDFYLNKDMVERLSQKRLSQLIQTQRMRGDSNVMYAEIEQHNRWSLPFSALILTIIGVSLSSKKRRGGIGWNIAIGIALSFSYILFMRFSQMFVYTATLPAYIAIWLPNLVFAIIAAVLYKVAPK